MDFSPAPRKSPHSAPQLQARLSRFSDSTRLRRLKNTLFSKEAWTGFGQCQVSLLKCVLLPSWRADLGASFGGRAPAVMAAEPPAQGGIQVLGTSVTKWDDVEMISCHVMYNDLRIAPAHGSSSERQDEPSAHDADHV